MQHESGISFKGFNEYIMYNGYAKTKYCVKCMPGIGIHIVEKVCQEYLLCKGYVRKPCCAKGMPGIPVVQRVCQEYFVYKINARKT